MNNSQSVYPNAPVQNHLPFVKNFFARKSVLALGIIGVISALISAGMSFFITNAVSKILQSMAYLSSSTIESSAILNTAAGMNISTIISVGISLVIQLIFVASFFIIYFKSKNPNPTASPYSGFMILKVFAVINIVFIALAIVAVIGLGILLFIALSSVGVPSLGGNDQELVTFTGVMIVIICVIMLVALAIEMLYVGLMLGFINSVMKAIKTPVLSAKGAKGFGVFNLIYAIFGGLNLLSSVPFLFMIPAFGFGNIREFLDGMNIDSSVYPILEYMLKNIFPPVMAIAFAASVLSFVTYIIYASLGMGYAKHVQNAVMPQYIPYGANGLPQRPYNPQQTNGYNSYNGYNGYNATGAYNTPQSNAQGYVPPQAPAEENAVQPAPQSESTDNTNAPENENEQ